MRVLTPENTSFDLNLVNESTDNTFSLLDCEKKDWFFSKFFMFQEFTAPSVCLKIDKKFSVELPLNWQILTGDPDSGELSITSVEQLSMFEHYVLALNPLSSFFPTYHSVEVINIYSHHSSWFVPRLMKKQLLSIVVNDMYIKQNSPVCVFCSDCCDKNNEVFHISDVF